MGVKGKLEVEVDIKSCGDLFHELLSQNPHHVTNATPDKIHACDLHEGELGKPGSVICWNYTLHGKKCVAKEIVEEIDEEKKHVRYKVIEGDLLTQFKTITIIVQVIPKGAINGVKWTLEFEKIVDDGPYPTHISDFLIAVTKDIEAHHMKT